MDELNAREYGNDGQDRFVTANVPAFKVRRDMEDTFSSVAYSMLEVSEVLP